MTQLERFLARHTEDSLKELMIQWNVEDYCSLLENIFERPLTPKEIRIVEDSTLDELS